MDREALSFGDVRTFCFFATGFLGVIFLAWADKRDNFLVEGCGDARDSEKDVDPLFSYSFQYEFKLSSINCQQRFGCDFGISTIEYRLTKYKTIG